MQIDWSTFAAQILNFGILLVLLNRFLYRPVLAAVDRREGEIASRLEAAERDERRAEEEARRLREEREALEEKRASLLRRAEAHAEQRREELRSEIRAEADQVREAWRETIRRRRRDFLELLRTRMTRRFYDGVRRALDELADQELEDRVVTVFLERLRGLARDEREALRGALEEGEGRVRIRVASGLPETRWRTLEEEVATALSVPGDRLDVHREVDETMALGVEVSIGDRRVAWSADSYLEQLEADTLDLLSSEEG